MMSPENFPAKPAQKDESQSSGSRKSTLMRPPEQSLKCPRCDSPNTKFCYYNNYSLSQPRHFCKTCRRYWTKGGALRNVPIGGGCRKSKKIKSSSSSKLSDIPTDSATSSEFSTGLKFFPTAMDFQLGGLSFPRLPHHSSILPNTTVNYNQLSSFGDISAPTISLSHTAPPCFGSLDSSQNPSSLLGFNLPFSSSLLQQKGENHEHNMVGVGSMNVNSSLATSIESLSSINQDLHLKLQQQRLAMLFGGEKESSVSSVPLENQTHKPLEPISFHSLEISKPPQQVCAVVNSGKEGVVPSSGNHIATEWFFDNSNSYGGVMNSNPNNCGGNGDGGNESASNWNGIQLWNDLNHYNALP